MLNRRWTRRDDEGQGLIAVIALVAVSAVLIVALEATVLNDGHVAAISTSQEQALQSAQAGLADYQTWMNSTSPTWSYAYQHCSSGTFPGASGPAGNPCYTFGPDKNNLAYSDTPDPSCGSSSATSTNGTPGNAGYFGWVTHRGNVNGFVEQFQYVVDSTQASASSAFAHVFVTGRAGKSGHFTCSTLKALYNGPQYAENAETTFLTPASCNGQPLDNTTPFSAPNDPSDPVAMVTITATGGTGESGGTGSSANGGVGIQGVQSTGGGAGGTGETVSATYAASSASLAAVDVGCQAGNPTTVTTSGKGFSSGGSSPGNAGGGGGSTAVCLVTPVATVQRPTPFQNQDCQANAQAQPPPPDGGVTTAAIVQSNVLLIAAGGGGGGEGRKLASGIGGTGGTSATIPVLDTSNNQYGLTEGGNNGFNSAYPGGGSPGRAGIGGQGGAGTTFSPVGGNGQTSTSNSDGGSDGGSGGGGFTGGTGGGPGWGGGGGGVGSSFYNTSNQTSNPSTCATPQTSICQISPVPTCPGVAPTTTGFTGNNRNATTPSAGSVTVVWRDASGCPISTITPTACGMQGESTSKIPAAIPGHPVQVQLQLLGGTGGNGTIYGLQPHGQTNTSAFGRAAAVVASYQNSSQFPVYLTAIQGCAGGIGVQNGQNGVTAGGSGLGNGGSNCSTGTCSTPSGNGGSGGGASTICAVSGDPSQSFPGVPPGQDSALFNNCCPQNQAGSTLSPPTPCTPQSSSVLMTAAGSGGGGGGAAEHNAHIPGGNGGDGGLGYNLVFAPTPKNPQEGIVVGSAGGDGSGTGGAAGTTSFAPDGGAGTPGNACNAGYGGDGAGGGGGYSGGGGGLPGTTFGGGDGCQNQTNTGGGGGGGGGSSYLCPSGGSCAAGLGLYECPPGQDCLFSPCVTGSTSPFGQQTQNITAVSLDEAEWCQAPAVLTGGAVGKLLTIQSTPPTLFSVVPATVGSTSW
jgi:hypothetical protein